MEPICYYLDLFTNKAFRLIFHHYMSDILEKLYPARPEDIEHKPHPKDAGKQETEHSKKRHTP